MSSDVRVSIVLADVGIDYTEAVADLNYVRASATNIRLDPLFTIERYADALAVTDSVAFGYGRPAFDTLTLSDSLIFNYGRALTDALSVVDALTKQIERPILDTVSTTDTPAKQVDRPVADMFSVADSFAASLGRELLDSLVVSDIVVTTLAYIPTAVLNGGGLNTFTLNE